MRRLIAVVVLLIAVALLARTWLVSGFDLPTVVEGSSMAPALLGAHRQAVCSNCKFPFPVGDELLPARGEPVCPNCGVEAHWQNDRVKPGQRIFIDRTAYARSAPHRWDMAVLQTPDQARTLCVKRIVGLPGEQIEIRDGDIYAGGRMARKGLSEALAMSIPVHDDRHRPVGEPRSRWQPASAESAWRPTAAGFERSIADEQRPAASQVDWLVYHHQQPQRGPGQGRPGPILDDLGYDQNESRELAPVRDVILRCKVESAGQGQLWLRVDSGRQASVRIDLETGRGEMELAGEPKREFSIAGQHWDQPQEVVLAWVDHRLQLAVAGKVVAAVACDPSSSDVPPGATPVAIGVQAGSLEVRGLEVLRDVYYSPDAKSGVAAHQLAEDELWVLGDNSAHSVDSRVWPADRPVRSNSLLGKVLLPR